MKTHQLKKYYILIIILVIQSIKGFSETPYCDNLSFEKGNFSNWTGYTWRLRTDTKYAYLTTNPVQGIINGRQTIISNTYGYDSNTGNQLKLVPSGFTHSARIGNDTVGELLGGKHQSLRYTIHVDSLNSLLIIKFAVVFLNPLSGHTRLEEPHFTIKFYNSNNDTIPDCANYDVYSSDGSISGFQTYKKDNSSSTQPVVWRDWTTVGINLLNYVGQDITLEFMAADCTHTGHYGYAYVAAQCQPMRIGVEYCTSDVYATLVAPDGFMSYTWKKDGTVVGTQKTLVLQSPNEGDKYQCELTSETGCSVTLESTIQRYNPVSQFTSSFDCSTNTVSFQNQSTVTSGYLEYEWDFGDGEKSNEKDPIHTYTTFGPKTVVLIAKNPPSMCIDTMSKVIYTFERQKVKISGNPNYCLGTTTSLYGVDAYSYLWSTGETTDTIKVGTPGKYWVIGYSEDKSCSSLPYYVDVLPYPDWTLDIEGNTNLCIGDTVSIKATGGFSYTWNTGEKTDEIKINKEGTYTVIGINENGCFKQKSISITKIEKPKVDFNLSKTKINLKNNTVNAIISPETNVTYNWDMGDGTQLTGSNVTHQYNIDYSLWQFPVKLTATNEFGCVNDSTQFVDVLFFVPNVFTPNGDGVNDVFMPNVKLEIYDRNAVLIYKGTDGWNGDFKGVKADDDTYFYHLIYVNGKGEEQAVKGYIVLKR